jgi:hypothetical protein
MSKISLEPWVGAQPMGRPMTEWGSESGHWYTREGDPAYTVIGKNGSARNTTLRDARKMGLVPSVTTIIGEAAKPGLEAWKANQLMMAALTLPRLDGEPEADWIKRVKTDSREHARKRAEQGERIHAAIEGHFRGVAPDAEHAPYVRGVLAALGEKCGPQEWLPEKTFNHYGGYGGKIDLHSNEWVLDFKTKEFTPDEPPEMYDEQPMQLAAYSEGLTCREDYRTVHKCGIVWISVTVPGLAILEEISMNQFWRGQEMFNALLEYWWAKNETEEYRR